MSAAVFAEATGNRHLSERHRSAAICKTSWENMNTVLSQSLRPTCLHKMQMSPACFQDGRRICIPKKEQQHSTVDTQGIALIRMNHNIVQNLWKDNLPTLSLHFRWASDKCQENKQCSQGFPRKFPREAKQDQTREFSKLRNISPQKLNTLHRIIFWHSSAKTGKDFTHCETWATRFGDHPKEDICSFEFLQKTSHVLHTVGNKQSLVKHVNLYMIHF